MKVVNSAESSSAVGIQGCEARAVPLTQCSSEQINCGRSLTSVFGWLPPVQVAFVQANDRSGDQRRIIFDTVCRVGCRLLQLLVCSAPRSRKKPQTLFGILAVDLGTADQAVDRGGARVAGIGGFALRCYVAPV